VAVGDLRSLPTSHTDSACALDYPVGCRGIERHAAPLGLVHGMRRQGCNHPNPGLGWIAGARAGVAGESRRHTRSTRLRQSEPNLTLASRLLTQWPAHCFVGLDHIDQCLEFSLFGRAFGATFSASARMTRSACMRSAVSVGVSMVRPPRPKASRTWIAASIFASMLVTPPLESLLHSATGIWCRQGRIPKTRPLS
jgi:hypothetical protein